MKLFPTLILLCAVGIVSAEQWCERDMYETSFHVPDEELQVLVIWFPIRAGGNSILHLCSRFTGQPIERHCAYNDQSVNATWDIIDKAATFLNCTDIRNNCMEEPFQHYYLKKNNVPQKHNNSWQPVKLGELAKTEDPCLLENGLPLTRKCYYNPTSYTSEWENGDYKNIKCLQDINQDIVTYDLNTLYEDVKMYQDTWLEDNVEAAANLTSLLTKAQTIRIPADLDISVNILEIITQNDKKPLLLPKVVELTNLLMDSDDSIVRSSSKLGTPNALIKTIETYLDRMADVMVPKAKCNAVPAGVVHKFENSLSVFYINPACSNVTGIGIYNMSAPSLMFDSHTQTYFRYLFMNQSLADIMAESNLEAAAYFPEDVWATLLNETSDQLNSKTLRYTLYKKKNFFVDKTNNRRVPDSIIVRASIPGYKGNLPDDIPLIFKHHQSSEKEKPQCGNWDYHSWQSTGSATANAQNLVLCKTRQTKSFGALIGLGNDNGLIANSVMLTVIIDLALDIISIAGCGLSLFGLLCIWMTAVCCKQWRSQSSNKLLLNMCLVLTLIMAYFLFINIPDFRNALVDINNHRHCVAEGAFLHYTILVLFFWMLFLAIMQYQRYVTVIGVERPRHFIAKYAVGAWGLPLIPTALVIFLDSTSYLPAGKDAQAVCYPSGYSLYFAVLLPISLIIIANSCTFVYILYSVHRSLRKFKRSKEHKRIVVQVRLSILLFFLLGISWVFGVLAHIDESRILSILFCLTATLQGFVLFIYFVVIDQSSRYSCVKFCCGRDYHTYEDTIMSPLNSFNTAR